MAFSPQQLIDSLPALAGSVSTQSVDKDYLVAFSGGLDSTVLLHALASAPASCKLSLRAVYVNHGLQAEAAAWARHCRRFCESLALPFAEVGVKAHPEKGESPEAAARHARYAALADLLRPGEALLTGHHQDDQAETLLLQLMRGAGPRGLAAMPAASEFGKGFHLRPLLAFNRDELEDYARQHDLSWVDDPSNQQLGLDRNFLRHQVMPVLKQRWPSVTKTVSRSARACAEASELISQLAEQDLVQNQHLDVLSIAPLQALSPVRRRNALFHWLHTNACDLPSAAQMAQIENNLLQSATDASPVVRWGSVEVRRFQGKLYLLSHSASRPLSGEWEWNGEGELRLAGLGKLIASPARGEGLKPECLQGKALMVRFRRGGERFRPVGQAHHRPLKKLFQEAGVPPWQRQRIPLVFIDKQLAAVVGYWLCEPFAVDSRGAPGVQISLHPKVDD